MTSRCRAVPEDKNRLLAEISMKRKALAKEVRSLQTKYAKSKDQPEQQWLEERINEIHDQTRLLNRSALPLYKASQEDYEKSVFISYASDREGHDRLKTATKEFQNAGYVIRTGFERQREAAVVDNIADLIGRSTVFLGIWSLPDAFVDPSKFALMPKDWKPPPGHWVPFELGLAVALHKPFRVVVDRRIDADWLLKPLRGVIHTVYDREALAKSASADLKSKPGASGNFSWAVEEARIALDQRIEERLFASTGAELITEFGH